MITNGNGVALFAIPFFCSTFALAFGNKIAMVYTTPLNKQATYASALPKNRQISGDPKILKGKRASLTRKRAPIVSIGMCPLCLWPTRP